MAQELIFLFRKGIPMNANTTKTLSMVCYYGGFASIVVSILVWLFFKSTDAGHAERLGIFIGLWAPTFFILSDKYGRESTR